MKYEEPQSISVMANHQWAMDEENRIWWIITQESIFEFS